MTKNIEDTCKFQQSKWLITSNNSHGKRIKYATTLDMNRIAQRTRSIFKQATKNAAEYNIICNFDDSGITISASKDPTAAIKAKTIKTPLPTALKELLRTKSRRTEMA